MRSPRRVGGALLEERVVAVSAGGAHTAVLTASGALYTFGEGAHGQLGHGDRKDRAVPTLVSCGELREQVVVSVEAGKLQTVVVTQGGKLYILHSNEGGTAGQPRQIPALRRKHVASVSAHHHLVAFTADGECYTWGGSSRNDGHLGHGVGEDCFSPKLVNTLVGKHVVAVAAGHRHTAALTAEGDLFTWGGSSNCGYGVLGQGDDANRASAGRVPKLVPRVGGIPWYPAPARGGVSTETTQLEEQLPDAYAAFFDVMRDTDVAELDDDALIAFERKVSGVHERVQTFNDALAAKRAVVETEVTRRKCAEVGLCIHACGTLTRYH